MSDRRPAGWALLDAAQGSVARRVIAEEEARREHLVVYLSGAHAYGFPSPDSDLDLKAVHVAPTRDLLALAPAPTTFDRTGWVDGVEIDYTSNEIGDVLLGVLRGNGNFLERLLGTASLTTSGDLAGVVPAVRRALSRRVHRHYRGFATSQRLALASKPTVKKLLYVLRTTLTGTHLLRTGELVCDVGDLLDAYGFGAARRLVEAKRAGENAALAGDAHREWGAAVERAFEALDAARDASPLPEEPPGGAELEAWLLELRRAKFG